MTNCPFCGYSERNFSSKFCSGCGSNWPINQIVDKPADVHRYVDSLYQSVQSSQIDEGTAKMIKRMRESFKISHATHERILEDLLGRLKIVEEMHAFSLEFNQNDSDAYAEQDTLLQFRLINDPQGQQLKSVELTWNDPDFASGRVFKASTSVPVRPGTMASLQGSHVFMRFGPKSIDRMQLRVELPWGDTGHFMVEPMVFNVRNPDQKISKNVTNIINQERGVVDNSSNLSDGDGSPMSVGRQAIWKRVVLFPRVEPPTELDGLIAEPEMRQTNREPAATVGPLANASTHAPATERGSEPAANFVAEHASIETMPPHKSEPPTHIESQAQVQFPHQPEHRTRQDEVSDAIVKSVTATHSVETLIQSSDPHECVSQVFKRLSWFAQASPIAKPNTTISSDRFDLDFLEVIYHSVPDPNEDDVLGMVFVDGESVVFDQHDCVINFNTLACVFTVAGVTQVSIEKNTVNADSFHSWGEMASMGWNFYRRRFGDDKFVVSFGDGSVSQNLPGCKFDLRQYKGDVPVSGVFDEANAWLQRLYDLTPPAVTDNDDDEAEQGDETSTSSPEWPIQPEPSGQQVKPENAMVDEVLTDDDVQEVEEDEDEARQQTLDEIGNRMQRFFGKLNFALQRCDENQGRCVYTRDRVADELLQNLHDSVYNTGSGIRVLCVEPGCALLNSSGLLMGFKGSASALCAEGVFHMVANSSGGYVLDGSNSFLSWPRFFEELHGDLIVREEGPDLWFGTPMNYLVRGCYVDYSVQVIQWDYFENYVQKDLKSDLALFKESIDWL